jgi:hypothetical protein
LEIELYQDHLRLPRWKDSAGYNAVERKD